MKKKTSTISYLILLASFVFGVLALGLMAAPAVKITADLGILGTAVQTYTGFEVMIDQNLGDGVSVGMVFALVMAILGVLAPICLCLIKVLKVKVPAGIIAFFFAIVALIGGALLFCSKAFFLAGHESGDGLTLGVGAIFAGIFSILNAGALGFYGVKNLK